MKPILFALALPILLLTGCAGTGYYGYDDGYYVPGYYDGGYYGYYGPSVDVGFYGSDRGYYHHGYHHYDSGGSRGSVAVRGTSHVSGGTRTASVSRSGGGRSGGSRSSSASVSSGGGHSGGGHGGGGRH
jgi:hypothetical protein